MGQGKKNGERKALICPETRIDPPVHLQGEVGLEHQRLAVKVTREMYMGTTTTNGRRKVTGQSLWEVKDQKMD